MKFLITGANGQLGQDIQHLCLEKKIEFIAAGSKDLDITDFPRIISEVETINPDIIINCAAYTAVDLAENEWKKAFLVNGLGVRNLSIAANRTGVMLVHYSTDYVFDGESTQAYTLADTPNPVSRYGMSKFLGEQMLRDIASRFLLIRTSWVFGAGNENFPKKVIAWSREKKELKFVTDQVSSPTYTRDLASATIDLIKKNAEGIFHITNSGHCSRYEWAAYILNKTGWDGTITSGLTNEFPAAAIRPRFSVLDPLGSSEILGYTMPDWMDATDRFLREITVI